MSEVPDRRLLDAGSAACPLIADPKSWINRRVETIELLGREEIRRRVSIDFTLSDAQLRDLWIPDEGVVVPISVLAKERRRTFDMSDESGRAIPLVATRQGRTLSLLALLRAMSDAAPETIPDAQLMAVLRTIVFREPDVARRAFQRLVARAEQAAPDDWLRKVDESPTYRTLVNTLWEHYVLFAVLPRGGPNRRVLKYSYSDDTPLKPVRRGLRERLAQRELKRDVLDRVRFPDRREFRIPCVNAWRGGSFHAEVVIPEELLVTGAVLQDVAHSARDISETERSVNRAALYATDGVESDQVVDVLVQVGPERGGRTSQASLTSAVVAALLWVGVVSRLHIDSPEAPVSIVLGGAALYAGVTAVSGEPRLLSMIFKTTRQWLSLVTLSAVAGAASLALRVPSEQPVGVWKVAAIACTAAALRLGWSAIRAGA